MNERTNERTNVNVNERKWEGKWKNDDFQKERMNDICYPNLGQLNEWLNERESKMIEWKYDWLPD